MAVRGCLSRFNYIDRGVHSYLPITLGLVFFLLVWTFHSLRYAALIMVNLPFAAIGGVVALWLSGEYLSVPASVGFIELFGLAVGNGIVLVSTQKAERTAPMYGAAAQFFDQAAAIGNLEAALTGL